MPKTFSDHERASIQESMLTAGAALLRKKGLRQVTVGAITKAANIATGSFYSFYPSREELLWEIIRREESKVVAQYQVILADDGLDIKTKLRKLLYEVYLNEDCISYFVTREELDYLLRKLPPDVVNASYEYGYNLSESILRACHMEIDEQNIDILLTMSQMLNLATSIDIPRSKEARQKVLGILVEGLVEYLGGMNDSPK